MFQKKLQFIILFSFFVFLGFSEEKSTNNTNLSQREKVVELAKSLEGKPYKYAAIGPSSFDCSGLVYYVFRTSIKIQLPRTSSAIFDYCTQIKKSELQPGDLVFFKTTSSGKISHVGIYIGGDRFISAISDGNQTGVLIRSLNDKYWKGKYCASGRILKEEKKQEEKKETKTKQEIKNNNIEDDEVIGLRLNADCSNCSLLFF